MTSAEATTTTATIAAASTAPTAAATAAASPPATPQGVDPNAPEENAPGDIPDSQVFVDYTPPSGGYHVKVPEGWARTEAGGTVVFTDNYNSVRIENAAASAEPTVSSATQDEVPAIAAANKNVQPGTVKSVIRKAGPAMLITYRADSDPNPVTGKTIHLDVERYEFWRAGKEVVLVLSGPVGADNVDPWRIVTDSFAWQ